MDTLSAVGEGFAPCDLSEVLLPIPGGAGELAFAFGCCFQLFMPNGASAYGAGWPMIVRSTYRATTAPRFEGNDPRAFVHSDGLLYGVLFQDGVVLSQGVQRHRYAGPMGLAARKDVLAAGRPQRSSPRPWTFVAPDFASH